jgi:di/tricarboxylate transporter
MLIFLIGECFESFFILFTTVIIFFLAGVITSTEAISGFSNDATVTVASLLVAIGPIQRNNLLKIISKYIFGRGNSWFWVRVNMIRMWVILAFLSTFLNNSPLVALFTPIIKGNFKIILKSDWCRLNNVAPSKFLLPMCFAVVTGGLCSLIGTSVNITVNSLMIANDIESMGFFEIGAFGLPCTIVAMIYVVTLGYCLLPNNKGGMVSKILRISFV